MPPRPLGGAFRGPGGNAEQMGLDRALPEPLQPLPGGLSVPTPHHPGRGCSAHDWGQGGRKGLTEADRGQGWLAQDQGQGSPEPPGTAERWREAGGAELPIQGRGQGLGWSGHCRGVAGGWESLPQGPSLVRMQQQQVHSLCKVVHIPISLHFRVVLVAGPGGQGHGTVSGLGNCSEPAFSQPCPQETSRPFCAWSGSLAAPLCPIPPSQAHLLGKHTPLLPVPFTWTPPQTPSVGSVLRAPRCVPTGPCCVCAASRSIVPLRAGP